VRDGQRGGQQKASNGRLAGQLAASMAAFAGQGAGSSQSSFAAAAAAAAAASRSRAKVRETLFPDQDSGLPVLQRVESDSDSDDEASRAPSIARPAAGTSQSNAVVTTPISHAAPKSAAPTQPGSSDETWTLDELCERHTSSHSAAPPAAARPLAPSPPPPSPPPATPPPAAASSTPPMPQAAASSTPSMSKVPTLAEALEAISDEQLRNIVRLFVTSGSKAVQYSGSNVRCSVALRKLWAVYSFGTVNARLDERGVNPTVTAVRQAVLALGYRWPWTGKSADAAKQVLLGARKSLKAGDFDHVDATVAGPKSKQSKQAKPPGASGPRPKWEDMEAQVDEWVQTACSGKQMTRLPDGRLSRKPTRALSLSLPQIAYWSYPRIFWLMPC